MSRVRSESAGARSTGRGRPRRRRRRADRSRDAVYGASEGLDTLVVERQRSAAKPARHAGSRTTSDSLRGSPLGADSRAVTQAPKFGHALASSFRAVSLEPGDDRHVVRLEEDHEIAAPFVLLPTGAQYRRLPVEELADYEGLSVFYAAGPPEAQLCGASRVAPAGGGNSAGQAAVWLARGGALVTLLHRRADLRETMSDSPVPAVERSSILVRDRRRRQQALHGDDERLETVDELQGS